MIYFKTLDNKYQKIIKWEDFNKTAVQMLFPINKQKCILMEGFNSYLCLKENVKGINNKINGIEKFILLGNYNGLVMKVIIDVKTGKITKKIVQSEICYKNSCPNKKLWKLGLKGNPKLSIISTPPSLHHRLDRATQD